MLESIQALRAVAALMVAAHHTVNVAGRYYVPFPFRELYDYRFGEFGVDLFFVISGFIMFFTTRKLALRKDGPREFLKRRLVRIGPMYWIATLGMAALLLLQRHTFFSFGFRQFFLSLLFLPSNGGAGYGTMLAQGWSLCFEMFFYVVFAVFLPLSEGMLVLTTGLFFAACVAMRWVFHPAEMTMARFLFTSPMTFEFWYGIVLGYYYRKGLFQKYRLFHLILLAGGCVLFVQYTMAGYFLTQRFIAWGIPAFMIVAGSVYLAPSFQHAGGRFLLWIGDASYTLYLFHKFVIIGCYNIFPHLFALTSFPASAAVIFLSFLATIAVSLLIYEKFELPLTQYLRVKYHHD